jgi:hypothetical protein
VLSSDVPSAAGPSSHADASSRVVIPWRTFALKAARSAHVSCQSRSLLKRRLRQERAASSKMQLLELTLMRVNSIALAGCLGLIWGSAILIVGCVSLASPGYGRAFLDVVASIYPGYNGGNSASQIILGTVYGLVDGAVFGLVVGGLYNFLAARLPGAR